MTRTDVHAPSSIDFDPEAYELRGVFDMAPDYPAPAMVERRLKLINSLIDAGYRSGHGSSRQCGHCGAHIRYAALMVREDVKQYIYVGEICLDNRFSDLTKGEFQALRAEAKLNRERVRMAEKFEALTDAHQAVAYATYSQNIRESLGMDYDAMDRYGINYALYTAADIATKGRKYGELSDRQIVLVSKLMGEIESKVAKWQTIEAAKATLPALNTDTCMVDGTVVSFREEEDPYSYNGGTVTKVLIQLMDGNRLFGTAPRQMLDLDAEPGDHVSFKVSKIKTSSKDDHFGYFSRPRQVAVVKA